MTKTVADCKSEIAQLKLEKIELSGRLKEAIHIIGVLTNRSLQWAGEFEKVAASKEVTEE